MVISTVEDTDLQIDLRRLGWYFQKWVGTNICSVMVKPPSSVTHSRAFSDYTDTEWNLWFQQPIPIMRPIRTPIMSSQLKADVFTKNP